MRRLLSGLALLLCLGAALPAGAAAQQFGIHGFSVTFRDADGSPADAGTHPFEMTTRLGNEFDSETLIPYGWLKDILVEQIPGLVGDTTAYPRCTAAEFLEPNEGDQLEPACPLSTQVGVAGASAAQSGTKPQGWETYPVFNVAPPPGVLLRLGFKVALANIFIDATLDQNPPYNVIAASRRTPQLANVYGSAIQLWGQPTDPAHDELRGRCGKQSISLPPDDIDGFQFQKTGKFCSVPENPKPFLTMPTDCSGPLASSFAATSWEGEEDSGSALTPALAGCNALQAGFNPEIEARPTSSATASPTGLDFGLEVNNPGLTANDGVRDPDIRKAVVTLPEGMTANPSVAEGLQVCSESELNDETVESGPGEGCPEASKIGTLEVESPLIDQPLRGSLYQAQPFANLAGNSLIAFYMVFKNSDLGVIIKQPVRVAPDPRTGQLKAITEEIPQLPFSSFELHFREGGRSPLVSPPLCGTYEATAELTPWSGGPPHTATSAFQIVSGPNEGPCPKGGTPPFEPGFTAGSRNSAGGRFSPFSLRLTRRDGDQDLTRFDATLPPGVLAKLAGVSQCPNAQIAIAKAKTGKAELASPSCPANSRIGSVRAGAGVGSQLTYVPGSIYLAGPFGGAPLSAVAVVPAVAGPFDVGTVVYRQALRVNPRSGEVTADGASSDPLPHILAGIPLVVRDVQAYVDRPDFTLNPTSCDPFATKAQLWGGGADPFSLIDNFPVARQDHYQATSCANLDFRPDLSLKVKGGTKRGDNPKFRAVYRPRPGDANLAGLVLRLPRSAFLDQAHIRTICTRVQYAAESCLPGSVYGHVRAFTPLLSDPLEGPAYLRSSDHDLPDIVFALHGLVDFEAVVRVDSKRGGIRTTLIEAPDAPITKVVVSMQGGRKGLIVNSTNLCASKHRADLQFKAHNNKRRTVRPVVRAGCGKPKK